MASLLERLDSRFRSQRQIWKSTPRSMKICFYAAIFSLVATYQVLVLLMRTTYLSPLEIFLHLMIFGGLFVAATDIVQSGRYWLIPVFGIFGVLSVVVLARYPMGSRLIAAGSPMHRQLEGLGMIGIVTLLLGYLLFRAFVVNEGALYFRAHNEIAMAAEIHRVLVPPIHKTIRSFEIYGISVPSGEVGADLVDVAGDGETWTGYVADVAGHGLRRVADGHVQDGGAHQG